METIIAFLSRIFSPKRRELFLKSIQNYSYHRADLILLVILAILGLVSIGIIFALDFNLNSYIIHLPIINYNLDMITFYGTLPLNVIGLIVFCVFFASLYVLKEKRRVLIFFCILSLQFCVLIGFSGLRVLLGTVYYATYSFGFFFTSLSYGIIVSIFITPKEPYSFCQSLQRNYHLEEVFMSTVLVTLVMIVFFPFQGDILISTFSLGDILLLFPLMNLLFAIFSLSMVILIATLLYTAITPL